MRVECYVEDVYIENEDGDEIPGICASCERCGHEVKVFGQHDASRRRALATLREECPNGERNFYVDSLEE